MTISPLMLKIASLASVLLTAGCALFAQVTSATQGAQIVLHSPKLTAHYHTDTGKMDILWSDGHKLAGIVGAAELANGQVLKTSQYRVHTLVQTQKRNYRGTDPEFTISSTDPGMPELLQNISISRTKPWLFIQLQLGHTASLSGTRHIDAVEVEGDSSIQMKQSGDLRVLHVPFDNDMWFRYNSTNVRKMENGTIFSSNEVTAIYDNSSRNALILGSIDHDTWKTAIDIGAIGGRINKLDIFGGITSPTGVRTDTHDTVPHGIVSGVRVASPRIFIGSFSDWRNGLEAYGGVNASVHPPLPWPGGSPMGWNSWAAYAEKIDYQRYMGAAAFVHDSLLPEGFGLNRVIYINLDAFWSKLDAVQLADAVATIKAMRGPGTTRFEPGIYWTPFAYWSDDLDAWVEGTGMKYRYRDILLKAPDGSLLPKVDGGRPIDPSHPGTKQRTSFFLKQFQQMGFKYLKLDFLSHGALEGKHFDPSIQTGIQAYNAGMRQIVQETGGHMFLSLSIAPLFPSGYGHARRISCDAKGHIDGDQQSTEYMLNSLTYGWWTSRNLYIADPDHVVLGNKADLGARNVREGKSRLLSAIISGGMILDSSRLADDVQGREMARSVYDNRRLFFIASEGRVFRPIEGATGDRAADAFVRSSPAGYYVAVFNYAENQTRTISIALPRISYSLTASSTVAVTDVESGQLLPEAHGTIQIQLQPAESKLLEIRRVQ